MSPTPAREPKSPPDDREKELRGLRDKTISGAVWVSVGSGYRSVLQFVFSVFLARLLGPAEFGLVTMAVVFAILFRTVMIMGLDAAVIRNKEDNPGLYNTAFTIQMILGICLAVGMAVSAPLIAMFYREAQLTPLVRLIALQFVLLASYNTLRGQMRKEMAFFKITTVEVISSTVAGALGIFFAWKGWGVYSLVIMLLSEQVITSIIYWILVPYRPRPGIDREHFRELIRFGAQLSASSIIHRAAKSVDRLLIGRYFRLPEPGYQVGIYGRAYTLMIMPAREISNVLYRVLFPAFSKIQDDHKLFRGAFVRAVSMVALLTFPMMAGLYAVREHFVISLLTEKWAEVIPVIRVLCIAGAIQSVMGAPGLVFVALGETKKLLTLTIWTNALLLLGFGLGILSGSVVRFALIYLAINVCIQAPLFISAGRLIGLKYVTVIKALAGTAACALLMSTAVVGIDQLLTRHTTSHLALLLVETVAGVLIYGALIHLVRLPMYLELRTIVKDKFGLLIRLVTRRGA